MLLREPNCQSKTDLNCIESNYASTIYDFTITTLYTYSVIRTMTQNAIWVRKFFVLHELMNNIFDKKYFLKIRTNTAIEKRVFQALKLLNTTYSIDN